MKEENIGLAMVLAKTTGLYGNAPFSTSGLALITGFSQQSISRKLRELEHEGLINRRASNTGIEVAFTGKGRRELESFYLELKEIFGKRKRVLVKGVVIDGLGEGTYYTSIPEYRKQFKELFSMDLFLGTLNLEVKPEERNAFTASPATKVQGFKMPQRTFGGIDCWACRVNGKADAVAIIPHRTNHPANILELVGPFSLRKKLGLKNGSTVEVVRE